MVVKPGDGEESIGDGFEYGVISYGSQTHIFICKTVFLFEYGVISYGVLILNLCVRRGFFLCRFFILLHFSSLSSII